MRERTTWNRTEITKRAAVNKKADPYTMNQDHKQPSADQYVTGDPSTFAEDVHTPNTWEAEYSNGQVKRDEIGLPEMRGDTFNHAEKTAALDASFIVKKADLCIKVAKMMLSGKKFASETARTAALEDQGVALMSLADSDLISTHNRLAADEEEQEEEGQDKQAQDQQEQQAQGEEKQANQDQAQQQAEQDKQANQDQQQHQAGGDQMQQMAAAAAQCMQAGNHMGAMQQIQQMVQAMQQQQMPKMAQQEEKKEEQQHQANQQQQEEGQDKQADQQQQQVQSQQQMQSAIQDMVQKAMQQQQPQQQVSQQQQQQHVGDDALLDQMLMPEDNQVSEADIQLDASPMDVGEVHLGSEDEVLRQLFANEESEEAEQAQEQSQQQQKQAFVRTAATRTVGTRPTGGVSRIGGGASSAGASEINKLESLWQSAPDVRNKF